MISMSQEINDEVVEILKQPFPENISLLNKVFLHGNAEGDFYDPFTIDYFPLKITTRMITQIIEDLHSENQNFTSYNNHLSQFLTTVYRKFSGSEHEHKTREFYKNIMMPALEIALIAKNNELIAHIVTTTKSVETTASNAFQFLKFDDIDGLTSLVSAINEDIDQFDTGKLGHCLEYTLKKHVNTEYFPAWISTCHNHLTDVMNKDVNHIELMRSSILSFSVSSLSSISKHIPLQSEHIFSLPSTWFRFNLDRQATLEPSDVISTISVTLEILKKLDGKVYGNNFEKHFIGMFNSFAESNHIKICRELSTHEFMLIPEFRNRLSNMANDLYKSFELSDLLDDIINDGSLAHEEVTSFDYTMSL
jgi:hypothetical protein